MSSEQEIEKKIRTLAEVAKGNKSIDAAKLAIAILDQHDQNLLSVKQKRWAYFLSLGFPPLGFYFAIKFLFSDKEDAHQAAAICALLTTFSIVFTILLVKGLTAGSGLDSSSLQQINPNDIKKLVE